MSAQLGAVEAEKIADAGLGVCVCVSVEACVGRFRSSKVVVLTHYEHLSVSLSLSLSPSLPLSLPPSLSLFSLSHHRQWAGEGGSDSTGEPALPHAVPSDSLRDGSCLSSTHRSRHLDLGSRILPSVGVVITSL